MLRLSEYVQENNAEINKQMAGLLCSAILSDTLALKYPTCTEADREAAESLAGIAGLDMDEFSMIMFRASSNLMDKSAEEIFYQDFKQFKTGELELGVGQVYSMDSSELLEIKDRMLEYMDKVYRDKKLDMVCSCLLTFPMKEPSCCLSAAIPN